jgi:hypothetical protein
MFLTKFAKNINDRLYVQRRFSENRAVYKVMWENAAPDRRQM